MTGDHQHFQILKKCGEGAIQNLSVEARAIIRLLVAFLVFWLAGADCASAAQRFSLGVEQESYFAKQESLYGTQRYQNVSARYRGDFRGETWAGRLDIGGGTAVNVESYTSFYAPEAYVKARLQPESALLPSEITVGRKREPWSRLDADWNFGLWQPLFRWDFIRPEEQGLTGAFVTWKSTDVQFTLFGSGLFIPEQGPPYHLDDDRITSMSPWFTEPANTAILFSQATDVYYRIEIPEISKIVLQPSVGARLATGDPTAGFWTSTAYINKPRNSLALPFHAGIQGLATSGGDLHVIVYPTVQRHHLVASDLGYATKGFGVFLTGLAEIPEESHVPTNLARQELEPQVLVSPGVEGRLLPDKSWGPRVQFAYLHQSGGGTKEEIPFGENISTGGDVFGPRMHFTQATSLSLRSQLIRGFEASVRWIEDFKQKGTLLTGEFRYRPTRDWTLALGVDVLGTNAPDSDQSGLINRFRGNDRVSGGIMYVF